MVLALVVSLLRNRGLINDFRLTIFDFRFIYELGIFKLPNLQLSNLKPSIILKTKNIMKNILLLTFIFVLKLSYAQSFNNYDYNTQNSDVLWDVIEYETGYLLTGYSQDSGLSATHNIYAEPLLIKLSKSGNPIDTLKPAGFGNTELELLSVYNSGFFYVFGVTNPPNDSFRLIVTKYDTLFNMIQRKEYPQLQAKHFMQLHKTKESTDSSLYLVGYYVETYPTVTKKSFILNYNFNIMEISVYKELPVSCVITDVLVDDTCYFVTLAYYNKNPWMTTAVRYDTAMNLLSLDTLFVYDDVVNNRLNAYFTLKRYRDSLYLCSGAASVWLNNTSSNHYASIVVQTYNSDFEFIGLKYWYQDSVLGVEASYNNSFVENNNKEYFIGATINTYMFYPDEGLMVAKADSNLNTIWQKRIECTTATMRIMNLLPTDDGGVLVLYWEQVSIGDAELYNSKLMKIGTNGEITSIIDLGKQISKQDIDIYPNPATTHINIVIKTPNQQIAQLSIIDIQGRIVLQKQVNDKQVMLDVSFLSKGVYIVEGYASKVVSFSGKFIKE